MTGNKASIPMRQRGRLVRAQDLKHDVLKYSTLIANLMGCIQRQGHLTTTYETGLPLVNFSLITNPIFAQVLPIDLEESSGALGTAETN